MSPATAQLRQRYAVVRELLQAMVDRIDCLDCEDLELDDLREAAALHEGPACAVCGCTQQWACEDGCHWVEPDVCSACDGVALEVAFSPRQLEALDALGAALPGRPDAGVVVHRLVDQALAAAPIAEAS